MTDHTSSSWRSHIAPTLRLAFPVMMARAGILVLATVDTAMSGHAGSNQIAWYGLGSALHIPFLLVGIGMLLGTSVIAAQSDGAGRSNECGAVLRVSLMHAAVYGFFVLLACQFGEWFLLLTGQNPTMASGSGEVLRQFSWGLPAALLFSATIFFLEGLHRAVPGMVIMAIANVLNVGLNWLFVFGHAGFPQMGAAGAALATSVVRWFMFIAALTYVFFVIDREKYRLTNVALNLRALGKRFRSIGYPMALGQGLESASFATMAIFAGWVGTAAVAAWTIAANVVAMVFMFALGLGTAGGIRVANASGRHDHIAVYRAGWTASFLTVIVIGLLSVLVYLFIDPIIVMYGADPSTAVAAIATLAVTIFVLVPDALQAVLVGALRGAWDFWPATLLQTLAFWFIMVPIGYIFGVVYAGGAPALMGSVGIGALVASLLLGIRFEWIFRKRTG